MPQRNGVVLILVLWVLILLSAVSLEFSKNMRLEVNMTRNFNEASQAYYLAKAGVQTAIFELIKKDHPAGADTSEASAAQSIWRVNAVIPELAYGDGAFQVRLENSSGWVDINTADRRLMNLMLGALSVSEQDRDIIIDSILDWRDADDLHRLNGAEDEYYRSQAKPYGCKNADFDSTEELLLVRGVTPELFYGGLNFMVTAFSTQNEEFNNLRSTFRKRARAAAQSRININAAPPRLLAALPSMTPELAEKVRQYRETQDFKSLHELGEIVGPEAFAALSPFISLEDTPYFRIFSVGRLRSGPVRSGVEVLVRIDALDDDGYEILEWKDAIL